MSRPSWVALNSTAHSFTELCKPLLHDKAVIHEGNSVSGYYHKNYVPMRSQGFFLNFVFQILLSFHIYNHTSLYAEVALIGYNTIYLRNKLFKYVCIFLQM